MLSGGDGEDNHWGKDRIVDVAMPDNDPFTGNELDFGQLEAGTTRLTIRLSSGPGPEVRNASGTSTVNWDGDVIDIVWGGEGNDLITGNDGPTSSEATITKPAASVRPAQTPIPSLVGKATTSSTCRTEAAATPWTAGAAATRSSSILATRYPPIAKSSRLLPEVAFRGGAAWPFWRRAYWGHPCLVASA